MQELMREQPKYSHPSAIEKDMSPVELAEVQIDLHDFANARKILAGAGGDRAQYLLGRLARFGEDWEGMRRHFSKIDEPAFEDDIVMESAYEHWFLGDFAKLRDSLSTIGPGSPRYTEAMYYRGLAFHHLSDGESALSTWREVITSCQQDPWIYRADFAHSSVLKPNPASGNSRRDPTSVLGRTGYLHPYPPDLRKSRK